MLSEERHKGSCLQMRGRALLATGRLAPVQGTTWLSAGYLGMFGSEDRNVVVVLIDLVGRAT